MKGTTRSFHHIFFFIWWNIMCQTKKSEAWRLRGSITISTTLVGSHWRKISILKQVRKVDGDFCLWFLTMSVDGFGWTERQEKIYLHFFFKRTLFIRTSRLERENTAKNTRSLEFFKNQCFSQMFQKISENF